MTHKIWDSCHPDYPMVQAALSDTVRILEEDHEVFGARFTTMSHGTGTTSIIGYEVVTKHNVTKVKGITCFDIHGYGIRDSLIYEVE